MEIHAVRLYHCDAFLASALRSQATTAANVHRCFGDKGDVEDITEGSLPGTANASPPNGHGRADTNADPADIISTVEFDQTGNYLATGDKGGRVVLFERNETVCCPTALHLWQLALTYPEKNLRIQVPHRVSISRAGVRLPQIPRNRRENQQDQVVPPPERLTLPALHKRQDNQAMEGLREVAEGRGGEQPVARVDAWRRCCWWRRACEEPQCAFPQCHRPQAATTHTPRHRRCRSTA